MIILPTSRRQAFQSNPNLRLHHRDGAFIVFASCLQSDIASFGIPKKIDIE